MLTKWLEPYAEKELDKVVELCEEKTSSYYEEINQTLKKFHDGTQESVINSSKIENAALMKTRKAVELSFRYALIRGIEIGKYLR